MKEPMRVRIMATWFLLEFHHLPTSIQGMFHQQLSPTILVQTVTQPTPVLSITVSTMQETAVVKVAILALVAPYNIKN